MNVLSFGLPGAARLNPLIAGGFDGLNYILWLVGYFLFDEKMISLFSMLFGAGLVLMTGRAEERGHASAGLFYRRMAVLLGFGLLHAYLLWEGDILYTYALCGMAVYPLRNKPPRTQILLGLCLMLVGCCLTWGFSTFIVRSRDAAARVEVAAKLKQTPVAADVALARDWKGFAAGFEPTPEQIAASSKPLREGSYLDIARQHAPAAFTVQTQLFFLAFGWLVSGRMLIGMALMKAGVFTAQRSKEFYLAMAFAGYGLGWAGLWSPSLRAGLSRTILMSPICLAAALRSTLSAACSSLWATSGCSYWFIRQACFPSLCGGWRLSGAWR